MKKLLDIWEFIQNSIGRREVIRHNLTPAHCFKDCYIYYISYFDSHCYGKHIFINQHTDDKIIFRHEYGHRVQSKILGILYYPIIFLPSYLHFLYWNKCKNDSWDKYYDFYCEKWANYLTKKDKTTKVMKLKIAWIEIKSFTGLPIYPIDILRWAKYYYANEDCIGLCGAIEYSISDLMDVYNVPHHFIPLLSPEVAKTFQKDYGVDTRTTQYTYRHFWWEPFVWELNGGRLGFLNWLIEKYKDDKTNLRKL